MDVWMTNIECIL